MSVNFPYYTTNATNATNVSISSYGWTSGGLAYQQLPSVLASPGEHVPYLTPLEWLERQIDDVCALATA